MLTQRSGNKKGRTNSSSILHEACVKVTLVKVTHLHGTLVRKKLARQFIDQDVVRFMRLRVRVLPIDAASTTQMVVRCDGQDLLRRLSCIRI